MTRTRRNSDRQLAELQIIIVFSLICITCSAEDDLLCSEGVCVPEYQCSPNGTVKLHGEGIIDTRFQKNECPSSMVCCKLADEADSNSLWSDDICNGKCVPVSQCDAVQDSLYLRNSGNGCTGNNICCRNVLKSCDGVCTPRAQCNDGIDLRLDIGNCPVGEVCCKRPSTMNNDVCKGKCVFASQCSDYNPVRGMVDLRYSNGNCPANQICCYNVKLGGNCDGLCLPRARCDDSVIDLRFDNDQCPNREICCQKPKSSVPNQDSLTCKGTCLSAERCPKAAQGINLRFSEGCPANEVCCDNVQVNSCDGTCTTLDQCADALDNTQAINLRLGTLECPDKKICCKKLRSDQNKCDGTCVSQRQCPELNTWKSMRSSENSCPFDNVCCKNPVFTDCDGKCVPQQQCNDDIQSFDLRSSADKCPMNNVCCKNLKQTIGDPIVGFCDGECVDPFNCADRGNINTINLRLADRACPDKKICCNATHKSNLCKGSCLPREQCDDKSIDLRFDGSICPGTSICCKKPKPASSHPAMSGSCDGTCLPRSQCSDMESINLRKFEAICPGSQLCCKVPKQTFACDGTCAPLNQCLDSMQSINLRYTDGNCPSNQICCKNIKTSESTCSGKCVPANRCPKQAMSYDPVDLRLGHAKCPAGEVCCLDLEMCDGSCVPKNKCDVISASDEINLRYGKHLCPMNQVCCKTVSKCEGTCVAKESCSSVDLRLGTSECAFNQVCCKSPDEIKICQGVCTQPKNCNDKLPIFVGINLRKTDSSCSPNEICCKNPIDVCDGKCVSPSQCPGNNIDLRLPNGKCPLNQVCCKADSCSGTCVPPELCADVGINLRYLQKQCSMNRVCCQKLKEPKATCPGQCVLPRLCPNFTPGKYPIDLRLIGNGCSSGQICCDVRTPFLPPPSFMMDIPYGPNIPISSTPQSSTLNYDSSCAFSSDPLAKYVAKPDVPWLATIWSRQEYLGIQRRQYECVGTLIKSDLVLTSADCLNELTGEKMYVRVGDFNLKPLDTLSSRRDINITEVIIHPDFNSKTGYANVAVVRLSKNASKSLSFCAPGNTELEPTALCFLVGWNKLDLMNDSIPNATPDKHPVSFMAGAKCDEGYICSDEQQLKSQCDEAFQGSPVICFNGSGRNWVQMGLTAGKSKKCSSTEVPRSFVAIASYEMWIKEQVMPSFHQIQGAADPLRTYLPPVA